MLEIDGRVVFGKIGKKKHYHFGKWRMDIIVELGSDVEIGEIPEINFIENYSRGKRDPPVSD